MRWCRTLFFAGLLLLATLNEAESQNILVQRDRPFYSTSLSGFVFAADDSPIPGAQIELMNPGWKNVIAIRETNINGFFKFGRSKPGIYYLRLRAPGFQTYQLKVRVKNRVKSNPKIEMEVAN